MANNKKLIEQIVEGKGADATSEIARTLNQKLKKALDEQRVVTAKESFGPDKVHVIPQEFRTPKPAPNPHAQAKVMPTFAELLKQKKQANGAMKEDEGSKAGIESRIAFYRKQIEAHGDPGGVRRQAIKKLEAQLRK